MARPSLRISKTKAGPWRWYLENMDAPHPPAEESTDYPTWKACRDAAITAHPDINRVWVHAVRGHGVDYEDSL